VVFKLNANWSAVIDLGCSISSYHAAYFYLPPITEYLVMDQIVVFATLALALGLFVWGRWRYDVVALLALLAVVLTGIVPANEAFTGFGHAAIVAVAGVLVVSRGLRNSGVVDTMARLLGWVGDSPTVQVAALTALVAFCSAFMNNVGALALLMPVAIQIARRGGHSPSLVLMPLAFGSLMGGMTTLIGTPPNIIIATFRAQVADEAFRMFDFTPVGASVALAGVAFVALVGWRLIPDRQGQASREELFHIKEYTAELRVPEDSTLVGKPLRELESAADVDAIVVGLIRDDRRRPAPSVFEIARPGDVLVIEADPKELKAVVDAVGLELVGSEQAGEEALGSDTVSVAEAVVLPDSSMQAQTPRSLDLRWRYGVNLLAVARQGSRMRERLKNVRFAAGDIVLLQGDTERLKQTMTALGCLPLAERNLQLGKPRRVLVAAAIFAAALLAAATGLLPVQIAFVTAGVLMVLTGLLSLREAYDSIDWSVIILLGAMLPVGQALESTGGARLIADQILRLASVVPAWATLATVLVGTMFLSDLVNNAAAAVLMAPIALNVAHGIAASPDPFLLAVAIGASCAFLTPIGHQSNTLVMGPGGYRFGDYWRMGLWLELIIAIVSVPLVLWFWPLVPN
jgi:di/tricarboxylate transporter